MGQRALLALVMTTALAHLGVTLAEAGGMLDPGRAMALRLATSWVAILVLAGLAWRLIRRFRSDLRVERDRQEASLSQIEQLGALNEMLLTLGRSSDVGLAFQSLSRHIGRVVPCDRLGLALLREGGQEVVTYSARVSEPERRRRPRPELPFSLERSVFGQVIRSCETQVLPDLGRHAAEFQDAGVLASQGFHSALVVPLVSHNRAIGALMVVARRRSAFAASQGEMMQPLAEVLAFASVAQQQQHALEKFQMMESMSDRAFALASDINGALQGVIGEASILRRQHPELAEGLDAVVGHAERTLQLLERMRAAAHERLSESDLTAVIPASPEAFGPDEGFAWGERP
jgi:GAF domain-containing protein